MHLARFGSLWPRILHCALVPQRCAQSICLQSMQQRLTKWRPALCRVWLPEGLSGWKDHAQQQGEDVLLGIGPALLVDGLVCPELAMCGVCASVLKRSQDLCGRS